MFALEMLHQRIALRGRPVERRRHSLEALPPLQSLQLQPRVCFLSLRWPFDDLGERVTMITWMPRRITIVTRMEGKVMSALCPQLRQEPQPRRFKKILGSK